jgi:hypothetical protein
MQSDLKLKAAIAGVLYYLQMEKTEHKIEPVVAKIIPTPWQLHGRTSIMQMRGLVQRRVLKRR